MISKRQVLNLILLHVVGVQEVSIPTSNDDLARNDNLVMHLVPQKKADRNNAEVFISSSLSVSMQDSSSRESCHQHPHEG